MWSVVLILLLSQSTVTSFVAPAFTRRSVLPNVLNFQTPTTPLCRRSNAQFIHLSLSVSADSAIDPLKQIFNQIDVDGSGEICESELQELLNSLGLVATQDEVKALFRSLDSDGGGTICFDEFSTWYNLTLETCLLDPTTSAPSAILENLKTRRTVNDFSNREVSSDLVVEALQAATMAPNHRRTEPWRFISLGQNSIDKVSALNPPKQSRWSSIKGWMVFTSPLSHSDPLLEKEDYAAVCCAIQNFSLALWAHGVGTKWTTGDVTRSQEFNEICGIDASKETLVGCVWYGYPEAEVKDVKRRKPLSTVLSELE